MIPKPLNEIEWSDLETLRDSGREEDDTLEFKGSFSGGEDFLNFTEKKQAVAVDAIAKEAIAFLNSRGGDIIIGACEFKNDHPRIEKFLPFESVSAIADRLAQSLAAIIEPVQTVVGVRAIKQSDSDTAGVIVVRSPASIRAPHRSKRTKDCFARRGRESMPMPMDEIQDVTLHRALARSERDVLLSKQFDDLSAQRIGLLNLDSDRSHFRLAYLPSGNTQIVLDRETLDEMLGSDPVVSNARSSYRDSVAYESLRTLWKPELRGRFVEGYSDYGENFLFSRKSIKNNLLMKAEFALRHQDEQQGVSRKIVSLKWLVGFFANSLLSIRNVLDRNPIAAEGVLRVAAYIGEAHCLATGERMWGQQLPFPSGTVVLPDFHVEGADSISRIFEQIQVDFCALAGIDCPEPFSLPPI